MSASPKSNLTIGNNDSSKGKYSPGDHICLLCKHYYRRHGGGGSYENFAAHDVCGDCRYPMISAATIYDRDAAVGSLPPNLRHYIENQNTQR